MIKKNPMVFETPCFSALIIYWKKEKRNGEGGETLKKKMTAMAVLKNCLAMAQ
ncbi:MAG: hypothetical protein KKD63_08100 [Proteobacteria bacterium]|nr:hypothetical protein [Pseudomonadota bacterium]MDP2105373.1 hypothetical protein [Desulfobulbaceae bacterium]